MAFHPPAGTELVEALGAGTLFSVALVREGGATLLCKRLAPRFLREPDGRAAMLREAKVLALARHPSLPILVRVGSDGHGPFILETRTAGTPLRTLVAAWQERRAPVPRLLVRHIARASIGALAELHALEHGGVFIGFIHGDLGPDHLLFGPIGDIHFVDFGAARFRGMDPSLETGDRGTLPFVAPEIARGEMRPTQAHDVYSLAATLVYLAVGRISPLREEAAMLLAIGERGIDPGIVAEATAFTSGERGALASALALDPDARLASALQLLGAFAEGGAEM